MSDAVNVAPTESKWFFDDLNADWKEVREQWREITGEDYQYALYVLPPIAWKDNRFFMGEPFGHTDNDVIYAAFVYVDGKYFARVIESQRFHAEALKLENAVFENKRAQSFSGKNSFDNGL